MNSKALLAATAAILALSAVSCGKDEGESSVSIAYSEASSSVTESADEDEKEEKTTVKSVSATETTAATTEISGTETVTTTTVSDEEDVAESTTSSAETDTVTETTAVQAESQEETTAQVVAETPAENNSATPEDNSTGDGSNNNTSQEDSQPEEVTEEPTEESPAENNTTDLRFTVDNLLNDASGLLSALGTPDYSGVAAACTTNGNDVKIYQFDGLEIQCYIDGETEYIFSIEITGSQYETDKGIKTGSSRSDVESAYGTGETMGSMTIYYSGNNEMDIDYSGDTVTSIFFYTPV